MKKITLCVAAVSMSIAMYAQNKKVTVRETLTQDQAQISTAIFYNFQLQTGQTYTEITGGIDINGGQIWDDPDVRIPIPFNCEINGVVNPDSLDFDADLGAVLGALNYAQPLNGALLAPIDSDIIDRGSLGTTSLSSITYAVQGSSPNRILKVQWKNCGSYDEYDINSTLAEFINFQLWIYEGTNIVEYRFGARSTTLTPTYWHFGEPGVLSGLLGIDMSTFFFQDIHVLTNSVINPVMVDTLATLIGVPSNGIVYRFLPINLSIENNTLETITHLYPNPVVDKMYVSASLENSSYQIFNIMGQTVLRGDFSGNEADISSLPTGEYIILITKDAQSLFQKLVKQ
jgi:hypothetical protein